LTIDFQELRSLLREVEPVGDLCSSCTSVILQNFTVDFSQLPFTQVTVSSVDTTARTISYSLIPGYQSPEDFNTPRSPGGGDDIEIFVFRDGVPITQTGRLTGISPVNDNVIALGSPGIRGGVRTSLAAIQPGTRFSTRRAAAPCGPLQPRLKLHGAQCVDLFQRLDGPYDPNSSGMNHRSCASHSAAGHYALMSVNGDGIHATHAGANNLFLNNIVRRTGDDALAFDAPWVAGGNASTSG